jgi:hypothetical protein
VSTTQQLKPLPDGAPYLIMPTTFGPGFRGPFYLQLAADVDFEVVELA